MGIATGSTELAGPERSARLDRAAQATIESNEARSPQAVAARYRSAYEAYGWSRHGQMPVAVVAAAQGPGPGQPQAPALAASASARPATSHAEALRSAPSLDQPAHPGHELFRQAQAGMRKLDATMGRTSDQHTDNMAASLAVAACREGLTRIDHVNMGSDHLKIWATQGKLGTQFLQHAAASVEGAMAAVQQTSLGWEQAQRHADQQQLLSAQRLPEPQTQTQTQTQAQSLRMYR
jgi:hypothetical protein